MQRTAIRLTSKTMMAGIVALLPMTAAGAPGDYRCETDPQFCYLDVGGDGCFDVASDVGPIDPLLAAGAYVAPDPGSVVCPPSVRRLRAHAPVDWETADGSDIVLHGTRVDARGQSDVRLRAGGRVIATGGVVAEERVLIDGEAGAFVAGTVAARARDVRTAVGIVSWGGLVELGARTRVKAIGIGVGGDAVDLGSRVRLDGRRGRPGDPGRVSILSENSVVADDLVLSADESELWGDSISLAGTFRARIRNVSGSDGLVIFADGSSLWVDQIEARTPSATLFGSRVVIGRPDAEGIVHRSRIRATDGDILLRGDDLNLTVQNTRLRTRRDRRVTAAAGGDLAALLDSSIQTGLFRFRAESREGCDLTGSEWSGEADFDCEPLVGP